jgi:hypothetical protein
MNTPRSPREILLARHSAARPALDAQHTALLAHFAAAPAATSPSSRTRASDRFSPIALFAITYHELVAPYRRAWAGLAVVWIVLLGFQKLDRFITPPLPAASVHFADSSALAHWLDQRRLLATLSIDTPPAVHPNRRALPPPTNTQPLGAFGPASSQPAFA